MRITQLWPTLKAMLAKGKAPDALSTTLVARLDAWYAAGGSRVGEGSILGSLGGLLDGDGAADPTQVAERDGGGFRFDVRLQGEGGTAFYEL